MGGRDLSVRIMVVDNDRAALATLSRGLRDAGYDVLEADDSAVALELVSRTPPHLALIDARMRGMSGIELAARLVSLHQLPFVFLSDYAGSDVVQRAKSLGALSYLVKPLEVEQIIPAIEAALARAAEIDTLKHKEEQLAQALEKGRETSIAVGILMDRRGLDRNSAFETLRSLARTQRRRIHDVASEIIAASEALSALTHTP